MKYSSVAIFISSVVILASGAAFAQQHPSGGAPGHSAGSTTGPAAGGDVEPSTAIQKQNPNIPNAGKQKESGVSGTTAGAPAIEGRPDTQSGKAPSGKEKPVKPGS
ncbi:hypothetical protein [Methylocystis heyeri]|uniref:Cell envelope biogenesis protein TolA n=1 Tax=Methylocystis heyeri TaxID=391905 RepID=A0A6B8KJ55_9HYPH|nr:hypothetical protein [Methylocystis heyeri]QGM46580.1 hypothetical protein H2LOC_013230 [Methylocystis heyeri]